MSSSFANGTLSFTAGENTGADIQARASSGTLRLEGAYTLATLTTGLNTGTAGTGTSATSIVKPTGAADWTATNLVGKWLKRTGGGGYVANGDNLRPILSNLTTTLAINTMTGCDNTTTFDIVTLGTLMDQISADVLIGIRVADCLGPVEVVGFDFSVAHSLDSLIQITDCPNVRVVGCNFAINTANPSLYVLRCGRVRVEHCRLSSSADISITDGCKNVAVTGVVNAGGGVVEISDFFKADVTKLSATSAPSRVLALIRGDIANVEAACSSGSATPVYLEAVNHMQVTGNGLTGSGNTGYGIEIAGSGQYNLTGSTITGDTGDVLFDGHACTWALHFGSTYGRVATQTMGAVAQSAPTKTIVYGNTLYDGSGDHSSRELFYGVINPAQNVGLTATGTNKATAYQCPAGSFYRFDTVASGTGAIFHDASALAGTDVTKMNKGANALTLYAPRGTIDGSASYSLAAGAVKRFVCVNYDTDEWFSL